MAHYTDTPVKWDDVFETYVIKTEADKVRNNTRDDYGLGPGWVFVTGSHANGKWTTVWGKPTQKLVDEVTPTLVDGTISAICLGHTVKGTLHVYATPTCHIGSTSIGQLDRDDVPDDVLRLALGRAEYEAKRACGCPVRTPYVTDDDDRPVCHRCGEHLEL